MVSKLTCICIDDELPALKLMEAYCNKIQEINLLQCFNDPLQALEFLKNNSVDLAIIDIQMPSLDGIEFFKEVKDKVVGIFISANPSFALRAFELDIIDYILKPASFSRFEKAINKVIKFLNMEENFILVKSEYISEKIKVSEINYVEGFGEYLKIITTEKTYLQLERMKDFELKYAKFGFIRIHKSYLIRKEMIQSSNFLSVTLLNGKSLPLGRVYKNNLK